MTKICDICERNMEETNDDGEYINPQLAITAIESHGAPFDAMYCEECKEEGLNELNDN